MRKRYKVVCQARNCHTEFIAEADVPWEVVPCPHCGHRTKVGQEVAIVVDGICQSCGWPIDDHGSDNGKLLCRSEKKGQKK